MHLFTLFEKLIIETEIQLEKIEELKIKNQRLRQKADEIVAKNQMLLNKKDQKIAEFGRFKKITKAQQCVLFIRVSSIVIQLKCGG